MPGTIKGWEFTGDQISLPSGPSKLLRPAFGEVTQWPLSGDLALSFTPQNVERWESITCLAQGLGKEKAASWGP